VAEILAFAPSGSVREPQVLGVRRVLELAGYIDNRYRSEDALDRGRRLDQVLGDMDRGGNVGCDAPEDLTHQIEQYITFRGECKPLYRGDGIEKPTRHESLAIRGRIDRDVLQMFGYRGILDIKAGAIEPWHRLQTALYWICEGCNPDQRRYSLYLPKVGRYKLVEHSDIDDVREAMDALRRARRQLARMV
jgi:hypothetical protein